MARISCYSLIFALSLSCSRGSAAGRRLQDISEQQGQIWGRCQHYDFWLDTGCSLLGEMCSDYLSDGPEWSDLQITLAGLTPSNFSGEENATINYLQFWAPRQSQTFYDPRASPVGASVYANMSAAYPQFGDLDFNGGNVRVDENGAATIRVQIPAAFLVAEGLIAYPSILLRTCSGSNWIDASENYILFLPGGPVLIAASSTDRTIISDFGYVDPAAMLWPIGFGNITDDRVIGKLRAPWAQTSPESENSSSMTLASDPIYINRTFEATTTEPGDSSTVPLDVEVEMLLDLLDDEAPTAVGVKPLSQATLESSPIYYCNSRGMFYDTFSGSCLENCTANSEESAGQCVLSAELSANTTFCIMSWDLQLACMKAADASCFGGNQLGVLHAARLAIASQLHVPFEEVLTVGWSFTADARRLSNYTLQTGTFQAVLVSKRLQKEDVEAALQDFLKFPDDATELFGVPVTHVGEVQMSHDVATAFQSGRWYTVSEGDDPYETVYHSSAENWHTIHGVTRAEGPAASTSRKGNFLTWIIFDLWNRNWSWVSVLSVLLMLMMLSSFTCLALWWFLLGGKHSEGIIEQLPIATITANPVLGSNPVILGSVWNVPQKHKQIFP